MKFWLAIDQLCLDELQDVHFYQEVLKARYLIDCISEWFQTLSTWEMFPMGPVVEEPRASSAGGVR